MTEREVARSLFQARRHLKKVSSPPKPRTKRNSQAATLKDRIRSDIESRIFSGRWAPGHRVPNEHELAAKYSCSRMTVNKVLSDLAAKGIIERRRKAGTFVAKPSVQSAVLRIPDIKAEVEELGYLYRYELLFLKRRRATKSDQDVMQVDPKHDVIEFRCLHWANQQPFALEHRLLNVSAVPEALDQDFSVEPPGTWLRNHVPWSEAEHSIFAENADAEVARVLRVVKGAACLVVQRRTWRNGQVITHVRTTFQGGLYRLNAHFTPAND